MLTPEDILHHPRFASARDAHILALTSLFAGDRFVTWMMADAAVFALRGFIVGCDVSYTPDDRTTWATPSNLRTLIAERKLASPRRVDTMIARFLQARYALARPSAIDRRLRLLAPTPRLMAHDCDHLVAYHRFLLTLLPGQGYEWVLSADPAAHRAIRRSAFRRLGQAMAFLNHAPIMMFLARDAGYLAFLMLACARITGREGDLSFTGIAETLGVSRTHIRNLFREAEAAGYVRMNARGTSPIDITPALWSSYERFLADVQIGQHLIAGHAFASLGAEGVGPNEKAGA